MSRSPRPSGRPGRPARAVATLLDPVVIVATVLLIVRAHVDGMRRLTAGEPLVLGHPPLLAFWAPHTNPRAVLAAVVCIAVAVVLVADPQRVRWWRWLVGGWLINLAWMLSLVLIDGLQQGWIDVLLDPNEYLADLDRIQNPAAFLATFTDHIAYGSDPDQAWTTHVAGHPPLITLLFWGLRAVGLGGGFWAGLLCVLGSSVVVLALPQAVRELGAPRAARRLVPLLAVFPGAVYMAVSADGLMAGLATAGLALVCRGAQPGRHPRRRILASTAGGITLAAALFCNYGLALFGLAVVVAAVFTRRRATTPGLRRHWWRAWAAATGGLLAVFGLFAAFGFDWLTGLTTLRVRYYEGIASGRPFAYFVWANLAAFAVSCSPLVAVALVRVLSARWTAGGPGGLPRGEAAVVGWLAAAGFAMVALADVSALSKAETERIWLTFAVTCYLGLVLLPRRRLAVAVAVGALNAVLLNQLFDTGW